jgi:serine/threonine protein phosphatase PrpC
MRVSWAAVTDRGMRRPANEDSYCARPELGLFVVADGMGGHAAGDVASRVAVGAIAQSIADTGHPDPSNPGKAQVQRAADRLRQAFRSASERMAAEAVQHDELRGMATTASAILLANGEAVLAHVGDSRVYLLRKTELRQLTTDHSWVQEQVDAGRLTHDQARTHVWRNVVTRAISGDETPAVDVAALHLEVGDLLLLCSDGLFVVVPDDAIRAILASAPSLDAACQALVEDANRRGGPDNVTALVMHVDAA